MTLIISSMCPRCRSWQRLKSGDGKCKGCGYNFYDGNIYASAFQETDTTMKRHCKKCDHNSYFLPDGNCPNCTHNDNQGRVAWDRVLTQKEIEIFMNQTPEEMRKRLKQKAKDFVAANDAIRFPPPALYFHHERQLEMDEKKRPEQVLKDIAPAKDLSEWEKHKIRLSREDWFETLNTLAAELEREGIPHQAVDRFRAANDAIKFPPMSVDTLNTPAAELRESIPDTYKMALDHFVEGQEFNVRKPIKTLSEMGIKEIEGEDLSRCPSCLRSVLPKGKCPNPKCDFDFDAYVAKHGAFPAYDHNKGGWKFGKTMAYGKRAFDANVVIEDMDKKFINPIVKPIVPLKHKIHARIEELKGMRDNSDVEYVTIPTNNDLDKVDRFLQNYYPIELEDDLLIYPTYRADRIRFEWQLETDDISIDLNLKTWGGYYHRVCKTRARAGDAYVDFNKAKDWELIILKIKEIKDENKA